MFLANIIAVEAKSFSVEKKALAIIESFKKFSDLQKSIAFIF